MPLYKCQISDIDGNSEWREIQAESEEAAMEYLADQDYVVGKIKKLSESAGGKGVSGVKTQELVSFTVQLRSIYDSGVPVLEGLEDIANETKDKKMKDVVRDLKRQLEQGKTLSEAMGNHPKVFDGVYVNVLRAGESGGRLNVILDELIKMLNWRHELNEQIRSASIYPIIMIVAIVIVVVFMLTVLVPRFVKMFTSLGMDLPTSTKILISVYEFSKNNTIVVGGIIGFFFLCYSWINFTPTGKYLKDKIILKLPVLGPMAWRIALSRFAQTLSLLWSAGVDPTSSLKIVQGVVGNRVLANHLKKAYIRVEGGESLSKSLQDIPGLPPLIVRMIGTGEKTGRLSETLMHVADFYNRELPFMLKKVLAVVQPMLTVVFAAIVLTLAMAILSPILNLQSGLK